MTREDEEYHLGNAIRQATGVNLTPFELQEISRYLEQNDLIIVPYYWVPELINDSDRA